MLCHAGFRKGIPMMGARPLRFVRLQHRKNHRVWNWITVSSQPLLYIPQKIYHIIHSTTSTIPQQQFGCSILTSPQNFNQNLGCDANNFWRKALGGDFRNGTLSLRKLFQVLSFEANVCHRSKVTRSPGHCWNNTTLPIWYQCFNG